MFISEYRELVTFRGLIHFYCSLFLSLIYMCVMFNYTHMYICTTEIVLVAINPSKWAVFCYFTSSP